MMERAKQNLLRRSERETVIKLRITYREQPPFWTEKPRPNDVLEKELEDLLGADRVEVIEQKRYEVTEV